VRRAVVYAGARIAAGAIVGDQSQVRELVEIGPGSVIGRGSTLDQGVRIGSGVLIQTSVYLCGGTIVEDDVFIGPGVITTNDNTMDRLSPGQLLRPPVFRRACRVGGGVTLVPGVTVGEDAYVAAGAVITRDVGEREVVMGVPARVVGSVSEAELLHNRR
jgi:acetyltransferase-like isoleucine patch superfamily enzyme